MIRRICLVLFLGMISPCFSEEIEKTKQEWYVESLYYLGNGHINLLMHEPAMALDNFQKATELLDESDKSSSSVIKFLISFGEAIAYDSLGLKEESIRSLGMLLIAFNEYEPEEIQDSHRNDDCSIPNHCEEAIEFLRAVVNVSPSSNIREVLFSLIDSMADELLHAFKLSDQSSFGRNEWYFDYRQDFSIRLCDSSWDKYKNFCKWLYEFITAWFDVYQAGKKVYKCYKEF